jgi:LPS O-antigen subunit length determinant protein (WzzB/FepE family)
MVNLFHVIVFCLVGLQYLFISPAWKVTVAVQEISALSVFHYDPSVYNNDITLDIMDLTQCRYRYTNRALASYVTNIISGPQRIWKISPIIY